MIASFRKMSQKLEEILNVYEKDAKTIQLSRENWVNPTPALLADLEGIIGAGNVLIKED